MRGFTSAYEWGGRTVLDRDGQKVGKIGAVYLEHGSDDPRWALVDTGLFGSKSSFVPLHGASPDGENVSVPVSKDQIGDAPKVEAEEELSPEQETELYRHYGLERPSSAPAAAADRSEGGAPAREAGVGEHSDDTVRAGREEDPQPGERSEEAGPPRGRDPLSQDLGAEELAEQSRILRKEISS